MKGIREMPRFLIEQSVGAIRPAGRCTADRCLILQYRRIALLSHDPLRLAVQPCNFERQMEYLATNCNVISMGELKWHLQTATPFRDHTVVVTFDGGYADLLYTAKDVLERYEVPAAVFIPSAGLIGRTRFWWDVLEDALIASSSRDRLVIDLDGRPCCWPLASRYDRFRAFDDLYQVLSGKMPSEQQEIVAEIAGGLDGSGREVDSHAVLGVQELSKLQECPLVTVGGYTHNGTMLSLLSEWEQMTEIGRNKEILEEILGHRIEYFAYPFGDEEGPTAGTTTILKTFGFTLSCRTFPDTISVAEPPSLLDLPRLAVGDWNPFTFYRRLKSFLD
ncbi:MAG: polysaccharide deacetylase family protein [Sedimentisphaerales bacterium]|nr:polysaccharide deacetylase family protein [Sedimentisphaerales bacterium]